MNHRDAGEHYHSAAGADADVLDAVILKRLQLLHTTRRTAVEESGESEHVNSAIESEAATVSSAPTINSDLGHNKDWNQLRDSLIAMPPMTELANWQLDFNKRRLTALGADTILPPSAAATTAASAASADASDRRELELLQRLLEQAGQATERRWPAEFWFNVKEQLVDAHIGPQSAVFHATPLHSLPLLSLLHLSGFRRQDVATINTTDGAGQQQCELMERIVRLHSIIEEDLSSSRAEVSFQGIPFGYEVLHAQNLRRDGYAMIILDTAGLTNAGIVSLVRNAIRSSNSSSSSSDHLLIIDDACGEASPSELTLAPADQRAAHTTMTSPTPPASAHIQWVAVENVCWSQSQKQRSIGATLYR